MCKKLVPVVCLAMLLGVCGTPAQGAKITWDPPVPITSTDVISHAGVLVHAGSWGQTGLKQLSVTAGGETIVFYGTSDPGKLVTIKDGGGVNADVTTNGQNRNDGYFTGDTGNAAFNEVMDSFAYDGANPKVLTLNGLIVGKTYLVQLFMSDNRSGQMNRTQLWSDSATRNTGNESATFKHGDSVALIGRFVADATTIKIYGFGVAQNNNILNGYQLRLPNDAPLAKAPTPKDGTTDLPRDTVVSWTTGQFAATHDVYLGKTFADVNTASRTQPQGTLVSQAQDAAAYTPARLDFSQTYYWRVDEVNAAPTSTIYKGDVWSFTTEPIAYPVDSQTITVTASSAAESQPPENTVNGSGLAGDLHGNDLTTMWLTAPGAAGPAWIQYQFDRVIQLHEMWVWNQNGPMEPLLGFGAKDVTITYSTDGTTFQTLGTTTQFARGPGQADYAHNTVVACGDIAAKHVKVTINSNWGGLLPQYGLSAVRFFAVPAYAREPSPAPGKANLAPHVTMSWRAGRNAGSHQVLLGTDPNQLTVAATVPAASYEADLNLGQTYYWKIAEVNQTQVPTTWTGDLWSFSTVNALVVEDFESYTDVEGGAIFQTWKDGFGTTTNGAQVGKTTTPYAERTFIHSGTQAMPLFYNNTAGATYSEATRTFSNPQDWTKYGIKALAIYFLGDPNNTGQLYLKINDTKVPYNGDPADIQRKPWQMWYLDLSTLAGINFQQVTKLVIGLDGGKGVLYVDDIGLWPKSQEMVTPVQPATTGLLVHYAFEGNLNDSVGGQNLTAVGAPQYTAGHQGQAVLLNGTGDYLTVTTSLELPVYTASFWFRVDGGTGMRDILSLYNSSGGFGISGEIGSNGTFRYLHRFPFSSSGGTNIYSTFSCADGRWFHAALVKTPDTMMLYINGLLAGTATNTTQFDIPLPRLTIGVLRHDSLSRYFPGPIDEVSLYNRVLSEAEIAYLAGRTAPFGKSF